MSPDSVFTASDVALGAFFLAGSARLPESDATRNALVGRLLTAPLAGGGECPPAVLQVDCSRHLMAHRGEDREGIRLEATFNCSAFSQRRAVLVL